MIEISIVSPILNEEETILKFLEKLNDTLKDLKVSYEIVLVLDPCTDNTEKILFEEANKNKLIKVITLSRRFGQPAATLAGLSYANGNYVVVIDSDLQDPPELIKDMYKKISDGYDVVYAEREKRHGENAIKKFISAFGYKIINYFSEVDIPTNVGDFRIMKKKIVNEILNLNESHGFLRGLVSFVGFKQTSIKYIRNERYSGKTKYNPFIGSLKIGLNGLFGFTSRPLQFVSVIGIFFSIFSFLFGAWYFLQKIIGFDLTPGLSTTVITITFFSGIQLIALGIIGEYIGRIYDEVKKRPKYIIDKKINLDNQDIDK